MIDAGIPVPPMFCRDINDRRGHHLHVVMADTWEASIMKSMLVDESVVAGLLPAGAADWRAVVGGESGATVLADDAGDRYAKILPVGRIRDLEAERDRAVWLREAGIPTARVLDWRVTDDGACLITQAVDGVPADRLALEDLRRAWPSVSEVVRDLHGLPVALCPFGRSLAEMMSVARATVAEGRVQVDFLPAELRHAAPEAVLGDLETELAERLAQEQVEQVVCHGDLCLPNIHIDPGTCTVTAVIDLGRLGRADPYADLALLLANARESWPDEDMAVRADREFAQRYGIELDPTRQSFYRRLDPLTWPSTTSG